MALGAAIAVIVGDSEKLAAQAEGFRQDDARNKRTKISEARETARIFRSIDNREAEIRKLTVDRFDQGDPFASAAVTTIAPKATKPKKRGGRGFRAPKTVIDARGSRIEVHQTIRTDSPLRLASATLQGAFAALSTRPLSGTLGTGGIRLALGAG